MFLQRFVVLFTAGFFVVYGVAFALFPQDLSQLMTGGVPATPSGLVDTRATYGGMSIAIGLFLLYLYGMNLLRVCFTVIIIVLMSMAVTRIIGVATDGSVNVMMHVLLALEFLGTALAMIAKRQCDNANRIDKE